jgi:hypothetical protein
MKTITRIFILDINLLLYIISNLFNSKFSFLKIKNENLELLFIFSK